MADNFEANAGSGGATFGSDDISGVQYPRSKLIHGANGTNDGDVSKTNPLPVGTNTAKDGTGTNQAFLADSDGNLQVDVVGALPAGTNAIGKLAANSGVDIGDVDVASIAAGDNNIGNVDIVTVPADPFGANADAASATGSISAKLRTLAEAIYVDDADWTDGTSKHLLVGGLYQSSQQSITDGDVGPLQVDANGNLKVAIVSGAGSGGTASTDDAAFTAGSGSGTPIMGFATSDAVNSGDVGVLAMDTARNLKVSIEVDNAGIGGGQQYAIGDAAGGVDVGTLALVIRDDALTTLTESDGDYSALRVTSTGALWVAQSGTWNVGTVTTVTTVSTLTTITNAVKSVGNTAHDAALSDAPVAIGGFASDTAPSAVSGAGDAVRAWFGLKGMLFTALTGVDGTQVGVLSSGRLKVGGDFEVVDDAAFTPTGNSVLMGGYVFDDVSPDTVNEGDAGAARMSANRCQYVNIRDNAGNERGLNIDASGQLAVTLAAAQTLAAVTTVTTVSTLTGGGVAHDAADSGNPHKIGMKATGAMTARTLVAADDRTDLFAGLDGVAITRPHAPLEDQLQENKTNTDGSSTAMTGGFAAPGANIRLYLTTLIISNSSATFVTVDIRDGSGGAVLMTVPVPATGGVVLNLPVPLKFTANTAAAFDGSAAASTISVTMIGFKSKAG